MEGDPRINRTIPGPGRPPNEFRDWCRSLFENREAREKLANRIWKVDRNGRPDPVLMKLMEYAFGKPVQVVEQQVQYDFSRLTREELETLVRLAERIIVPLAAGALASGAAGTFGNRGGQTAH